jgi:integrating conjugative element protein (TIGR03752 family)
MKANGLVKILIVIAVVALLLILLRDGSTKSVSDDMPPPAPLINSVTSSDNNNATVTTLLSRDREREEKVSTLVEEINSLKETIMTGTQTNSTTNNEGVSPEVEAAIESKFKKEKKELEKKSSEVDKLLAKLNSAVESTSSLVDKADGYRFSDPKNPLNKDYEYEVEKSGDLVWTYPIDQPSMLEDGVFTARNWVDGVGSKISDSSIVEDVKAKVEPKPVFTLPENTQLFGAKLASRLVATIPKGGTVENPMGFIVEVPKNVLAANGFRIPDLAKAQMGGYAVGNYPLECARGYITSFTFIFDDGRIAQVGTNLANSGSDGISSSTLAVITDKAGTECISGEVKSDIAFFIGTNTLLGAAAGAASAFSSAEETVQKGSDSTSSSVTGNTGNYIAGAAAESGLSQTSDFINEMWKDSNSFVVVDIATEINISIKQAIKIDYDANARKVFHEWSNESSEMESFWQ